jgi:hypothetical protein
MSSFNSWVDEVVYISGLPNNESTKRVAAGFIFRLPASVYFLSTRHVAKQLVKAAAYQVAQEVLKTANETKATDSKLSVVKD